MYSTDVAHKVIYLNTFSKTPVPSIRISYMVLAALAASPLARVVRASEWEAGTHMLLRLDTCLPEERLHALGREHGLGPSFLSDYCYDRVPEDAANTLVFNYAGITREQIEPILRVLKDILAGDIVRGTGNGV